MPDQQEHTNTITCSDEHMQLMSKALEFYARMGIGQLEELEWFLGMEATGVLDTWDREATKGMLNAIKRDAFGHPPNGSFGIHNEKVDDNFRKGWDIHKVLQNTLALKRKPEGTPLDGLAFDPPYKISNDPDYTLPVVTAKT